MPVLEYRGQWGPLDCGGLQLRGYLISEITLRLTKLHVNLSLAGTLEARQEFEFQARAVRRNTTWVHGVLLSPLSIAIRTGGLRL